MTTLSKQGGTRCADSAASCSSPCPTSPLRSSRIAACIVFGVDGARYRRIAMEGGVGLVGQGAYIDFREIRAAGGKPLRLGLTAGSVKYVLALIVIMLFMPKVGAF